MVVTAVTMVVIMAAMVIVAVMPIITVMGATMVMAIIMAVIMVIIIMAGTGIAAGIGAMAWVHAGDGHPLVMFGFAATSVRERPQHNLRPSPTIRLESNIGIISGPYIQPSSFAFSFAAFHA
jgi:hypothetical protein